MSPNLKQWGRLTWVSLLSMWVEGASGIECIRCRVRQLGYVDILESKECREERLIFTLVGAARSPGATGTERVLVVENMD